MDRHADTRPLCQPPTKLFEYNPAVNQQQQVSINLRFGGPTRLPGQQAASLVWYGPRFWTKILKVPVAFSFDLPFTKRFDWPSLSSVHPPSHPLDKREIFSRPLLTSNEFQNLGAKDLWPVGRINKKKSSSCPTLPFFSAGKKEQSTGLRYLTSFSTACKIYVF